MAIMLGGAAAGAAKRIKETLIAIAAHNFECSPEDLEYRDGGVSLKGAPEKKRAWDQLVEIAHRKFDKVPPGLEPGLQAKFVWEVPTGGGLPTPEGRIQIYPCYAFEAHLVLLEIDPDTGKPAIRKYVCGHDCGVMINPDIVHGMTYGGIAHGIGAALYEKFSYTEDGQLASGTFMDYLIPSAMEVPALKIVDHCTPSPLTTFGQKGSGEAGYLGAPAASANAINDALEPRGAAIDTLRMSPRAGGRMARQFRLRAALGGGRRLEPLLQRLPRGGAARGNPFYSPRDGAAAARRARRRSAGRSARQGFRRSDDRYSAERQCRKSRRPRARCFLAGRLGPEGGGIHAPHVPWRPAPAPPLRPGDPLRPPPPTPQP